MIRDSLVDVIAEPTRRQILDQLLDGELAVSALVERLRQPQPTVSKHLRVLREAGLVSARADGPRRMYQLHVEPLIELDTWLEPYRQMWRKSLDKLEDHVANRQPSATKRMKP